MSGFRQFVLAFVVGLVVLGLPLGVVTVKLSAQRRAPKTQEEVYQPQPSDALSILASVKGAATAAPDTLVLLRLDPAAGEVVLAVLPPELMVEDEGGFDALAGLWKKQGPQRAAQALSHTLDLPVDRWVSLSAEHFIDLADALGTVDYPLEQPLRSADGGVVLERGRQLLDGRKLRALTAPAGAEQESRRLALMGELLQEAATQRLPLMSPGVSQAVFEAAVNAGGTNLTISDYEARRRACAYLRDHLSAVRVLPVEGEYNAARNTFLLSSLSAQTLREVFAPQAIGTA